MLCDAVGLRKKFLDLLITCPGNNLFRWIVGCKR